MCDNEAKWVKDEETGAWYYYYSNGESAKGWQKLDGEWYYFYNDGSMTWSNVVDGYYLGSDGKMVTNEGWVKTNENGHSTSYYVGSDGKVVNDWKQIGDSRYYFYSNGDIATGWVDIDGEWYYFYSDGQMATGWLESGDDWYYLCAEGYMTSDKTVDGYHLDTHGKMVTGTGWKDVDGDWYYLKDDGEVATDWLYNQGNWYYLYPQGSMAHAAWINGDYVDDNGEWISNMGDTYNSENNDGSNSQDTNNTYEEPRWNDKVVSYIKGTQRFQWFRQETQEGGLKSFFDVGGFDRDENGVYHAKQDAILQSRAGYNDLYDDVFNLGCSMNKKKFEFSTSSGKYIVWLWKGDYLNLGAGAEIGIYKGGEPWWGCDIEDAMPMTLRVEDKEGNLIFDWKPTERNWWCTGFNPEYQDMQEQNLTVYGSIDFSKHLDMCDVFFEKYKKDPVWNLKGKPVAKFEW